MLFVDSFSTLCSGRVFATMERPGVGPEPPDFQYPVFGSSVCNRQRWTSTGSPARTFSTLCSGRVFATAPAVGLEVHLAAFSTLCSGRVFATAGLGGCLTDSRTFSTLCSGRVFATRLPARAMAMHCCLSVPCVRVECLQPQQPNTNPTRAPFQYPVFGSSVCNLSPCFALALSKGSFSTLCSGRVFATH